MLSQLTGGIKYLNDSTRTGLCSVYLLSARLFLVSLPFDDVALYPFDVINLSLSITINTC